MRRPALALALVAVLLAPRAGEGAPPHPEAAARKLAVIPFYSPEQMWRLYTPMVEYLRRETGEAWELTLHPSHEALIEDFCAGRVDVALVGPLPLGRIHRKCGGAPFLVALGPGGKPTYHAVLLTADPAVAMVSALRGKDVGFFRGSTAAHLVPMKLLSDAGLPPGSYRAVFLQSQDGLMAALLAGKISAAGVKSALYRRFENEPGLRLLQRSEPLPNFAFAALPSVNPHLRDHLAAALLAIRPSERPADAALVSGWDDEVRHGFVPPPAEFLPAVLRLLELADGLPRDPN